MDPSPDFSSGRMPVSHFDLHLPGVVDDGQQAVVSAGRDGNLGRVGVHENMGVLVVTVVGGGKVGLGDEALGDDPGDRLERLAR